MRSRYEIPQPVARPVRLKVRRSLKSKEIRLKEELYFFDNFFHDFTFEMLIKNRDTMKAQKPTDKAFTFTLANAIAIIATDKSSMMSAITLLTLLIVVVFILFYFLIISQRYEFLSDKTKYFFRKNKDFVNV